MAKVSDILTTVLSDELHIDALLDIGPDWNYMTPLGNTIRYTYSVASGNESTRSGQAAFSASQQANADIAFTYISQLTGINFVATADGQAAQIHLANANLAGANITGLCSWSSSYTMSGDNTLLSYTSNAYVYLDNLEWAARNANLAPGGNGYETLLHELGHALGLKHSFEGDYRLPGATDNTANTLMSYTPAGGAHATFSPYDVAALNWIYGQDGLRGALGINSVTGARFITGTSGIDTLSGTEFNDTLQGDGGNDMINGGAGTDTAVFRGTREAYTFTQLEGGSLRATSTTGLDGVDILAGVEILQFSNGSYQSAQVLDSTPPSAPKMNVTKNANGYVLGEKAFAIGTAEAGATVKVYYGSTEVGSVTAGTDGVWSLSTAGFADGKGYQIYAKAIDASGNISEASAVQTFNVDAHAPSKPNGNVALNGGSNQPVFSGTGEAGTLIDLVHSNFSVGKTIVAANGTWQINASPLMNGTYNVVVVSVDLAENYTFAEKTLPFTVASAANLSGSAANDRLVPTAGNNAVDGGAGTDIAVYAGARANYLVAKDVNGYVVTDKAGNNGLDGLYHIERIKFDDGMVGLDINGVGGQAYRLYQAAFDRIPDALGLGYWIQDMDKGKSLIGAAQEFIQSDEFIKTYKDITTDLLFIGQLYNNVLHRPGEQAGIDYWQGAMGRGETRADVLAQFSESPENQAQVIGRIEDGFEFLQYGV